MNQSVINIIYSFLIAIISYFCIEAFYNLMVNFNAFIFMNLSKILIILPSLLATIVFIIIEIIILKSEKIKKEFRIYLVIFLISVLRVLVQFIITTSIILVINFSLLLSTLIFFIEYFNFIYTKGLQVPYSITISGIIIGIELQFLFLIADVSSNLSWSTSKIVSTFLFVGLLLLFDNYLFFPKKTHVYQVKNSNNTPKINKRDISYFHFIILGIIFMVSLIWIFNPMALSAYDILDIVSNDLILSGISIYWLYDLYGFMFYILPILGLTVISYFISNLFINYLNQKIQRFIITSIIGLYCILNILAFFIIENEYTYFSTIYLLILTGNGIFSIILYFSYLLNWYSFSNRKKMYNGLVIFILTVFFFIILQVEILWRLKPSLIINVIILIASDSILITFIEFRYKTVEKKGSILSGINESKSNQWKGSNLILLFIFVVIVFVLLWNPSWREYYNYYPYYPYYHITLNILIIAFIGMIFLALFEIWLFLKKYIRKMNKIKIRFTPSNWKFTLTILILLYLTNAGLFDKLSNESRVNIRGNEVNPIFMTWNIHNAIGVDNVFDLDRIVNYIKTVDPDVLLLNEVDKGALKTGFIDIVAYIAHKLHMYYYYGNTYYKHYGNAILSKFHALDFENINLPRYFDELRSMIKVKFRCGEYPYDRWVIFATHLSTKQEDRLLQIPFILSEIEKITIFERFIWMGDFNFEPSSIEYSMINSTSSLNFTDTYRFLNSDDGFTGDFDENNVPQKRIDYIFCHPSLIPLTSTTLCTIASDHCAVITSF